MALYEVVFIARQDLAAEDVDALTDKISKIVTDNKGKVVSKEYWGLKNLAYKINKNPRGHYVLINIDANNEALIEMERVMGLSETIVRNKILRVKEHSKNPSRLVVSNTAQDFKAGKTVSYIPSEVDGKIEKIVINNLG
jgi:small subunit ribosomal protein S6